MLKETQVVQSMTLFMNSVEVSNHCKVIKCSGRPFIGIDPKPVIYDTPDLPLPRPAMQPCPAYMTVPQPDTMENCVAYNISS